MEEISVRERTVHEVAKIRGKIAMYTAAISMSLHLLALGSQGRVERRLTGQAAI